MAPAAATALESAAETVPTENPPTPRRGPRFVVVAFDDDCDMGAALEQIGELLNREGLRPSTNGDGGDLRPVESADEVAPDWARLPDRLPWGPGRAQL